MKGLSASDWMKLATQRCAIIDGEVVPASTVPGMLRYVGMWRPPYPPVDAFPCACRCRETLDNPTQARIHWRAGCWDVAQYQGAWRECGRLYSRQDSIPVACERPMAHDGPCGPREGT